MVFKQGVPVKQLDNRHYKKWDAVNIQEFSRNPPSEEQDTLALYMVDVDAKASKRFIVTKAISELSKRKTEFIAYGTSKPDGSQIKIIIQWEKEIRR